MIIVSASTVNCVAILTSTLFRAKGVFHQILINDNRHTYPISFDEKTMQSFRQGQLDPDHVVELLFSCKGDGAADGDNHTLFMKWLHCWLQVFD